MIEPNALASSSVQERKCHLPTCHSLLRYTCSVPEVGLGGPPSLGLKGTPMPNLSLAVHSLPRNQHLSLAWSSKSNRVRAYEEARTGVGCVEEQGPEPKAGAGEQKQAGG